MVDVDKQHRWQVIGRHKWVDGATITESIRRDNSEFRRFTATIFGYRNWRIWTGNIVVSGMPSVVATVMARVVAIRARISVCDDSVFTDPELPAW